MGRINWHRPSIMRHLKKWRSPSWVMVAVIFFLFDIFQVILLSHGICLGSEVADIQRVSDQSSPSAVIRDIEVKMGSVQTLTADFIQIKKMALFDMPLEIRGTIHVEKKDTGNGMPNEKFAWKVKSPLAYSLIMEGNQMVKWDKETGQTTRISLDDNLVADTAVRQIKLWFSGKYSAFIKDYDITVTSEDPVSLQFSPKPNHPASGMIKKVTVRFREDQRYISRIGITEVGGDDTRIQFENIHINAPILPSVWIPGQ